MYDRVSQQQIGDGLPQHVQFSTPLLFDHDRQLIAGLGQVTVWNVDTAHWGDKACDAAGRNLTQDEWRRYLPPGEPYRPTCPQFPAGR